MPGVIEDLEKLIAIPSIAFPGYPAEPVERMGRETLQMFRDVGFTNAQLMEVPSGYPPIYGGDRRTRGITCRGALCPLRRAAGAARAGLDV